MLINETSYIFVAQGHTQKRLDVYFKIFNGTGIEYGGVGPKGTYAKFFVDGNNKPHIEIYNGATEADLVHELVHFGQAIFDNISDYSTYLKWSRLNDDNLEAQVRNVMKSFGYPIR